MPTHALALEGTSLAEYEKFGGEQRLFLPSSCVSDCLLTVVFFEQQKTF
jgi:hypothetical protein